MAPAETPAAATPAAPALPALGDDLSPEIFRQLYVGLTLPPDVCPVVIGITSAIGGEGRTTVALGLALTLAGDLDTPITLVEADLERPALSTPFGLPPAPGLCEVVRGDCPLAAVTHAVSDTLSVVTAGDAGDDAARLLRELSVRDPFHAPDGPRGIVVLDLPPIITHSYTRLAAGIADAVALVVRAGVTPAAVVREAIARLEDRPPQGVVLNAPRSSLPRWWPGRDR